MPGHVCEFCVGQSGRGIEFSLSTFIHSFQYHSTHSSSSEYCDYEEDRWVTLGTLKRKGTRFGLSGGVRPKFTATLSVNKILE